METSKKITEKSRVQREDEDDEYFEEGEEEYEDESSDSLSSMPAEYVKMTTTARVLFEDQEEKDYYDRQLLIIGNKIKDLWAEERFKEMLDSILPARRAAKSSGDIQLYANLVQRQMEHVTEFYHRSDKAIEDAHGDPDKFNDSLDHWAEHDPEFPKKLELFMEVEAMLYYAKKWETAKEKYLEETGKTPGQEGFDERFNLTLEKIIEMNK